MPSTLQNIANTAPSKLQNVANTATYTLQNVVNTAPPGLKNTSELLQTVELIDGRYETRTEYEAD